MAERPDFKNTGKVEKNATPWSKERFNALLLGQTIEKGAIKVTLDELKKCEGDATANNRKAKLIFLYDWVLELKFTATIAGNELAYKGVLEVPNLSDENTAEELDLNISIETRGPQEAELRHLLANDGLAFIRRQLGTYIRELKEEFSKGIILPTQSKPQVVVKGGKTAIFDKRSFQNEVVTDAGGNAEKTPAQVETTDFEITETFKVPPSRLFEILTANELVKAWAGSGEVDAKVGGKFVLFGGQITGTFTAIEENEKIEADWRLREYPPGHHARIVFSLHDKSDSTDLVLKASNVPKAMAENTQSGLQRHYFQNIGRTFACGLRMF
ncbi:Activator of Hsp90 ATPase [Aphelenchoides fujianensis]|nr:Activator of Hsp90 ATPase [Aphelenchoides fujianensis]